MPSRLISDSLAAASSGADDVLFMIELRVWPNDVMIYELPVEQFLVSDLIYSRVVQGLLKLHGLTYTKEIRSNAECMTSSGKTPFLRTGSLVIEQQNIMKFLQTKGFSHIQDFPPELKLRAMSFMAHIDAELTPLELSSNWMSTDAEIIEETKKKFCLGYPSVVGPFLFYKKQRMVKQQTVFENHQTKSHRKSFRYFCSLFDERLKCNPFLLGDSPCEVDVVLAAHLSGLLDFKRTNPVHAEVIQSYPNLIDYCQQFSLDGPGFCRKDLTITESKGLKV